MERPLFTFPFGVTSAPNIPSFHELLFLVVQRPTSVGNHMNYMRQKPMPSEQRG
jgi:hypothetical protein